MRRLLLAILSLLLLISCKHAKNHPAQNPAPPSNSKPQPTPSYTVVKARVEAIRMKLKRELLSAPVGSERKILANAADSLVEIIGKVFHDQWKGTPWDFNGATSKPKEGSIACGYFVTGLLEDAGYKLNRSKLSTCPSLTMMRTLTAPGEVENLSALPFEDFVKRINNRGVNLYIVGLDFHTGFIVNDGKEVWFLHSNYIKKIGVVKETMLESVALKASKTKFLVCLTDSKKFLTTWLLN